ncbi:MAG TPA: hypothetical protein DEP84_02140 [Chloroflexi bacterium]|nr:hypothetical protein [Chloroflexota bacterium]
MHLGLRQRFGRTGENSGRGERPIDEELVLVAGQLAPVLAEGLVCLGVWMSFAAATTLRLFHACEGRAHQRATADRSDRGGSRGRGGRSYIGFLGVATLLKRLHQVQSASPMWHDHRADLSLDDSVSGLAFSPDGQSLYWTAPTRHDPARGMPRDYALYRYQIASGTLSVVTGFPPSFIPWWGEARRLPGSRLAIYGVPVDSGNLREDGPHVLIEELETSTITEVRLQGITAGQVRVETTKGDENLF